LGIWQWEAPNWVEAVLRNGGWSESNTSQMDTGSGSGSEVVLFNNQVVLEALVFKEKIVFVILQKYG